jgi:2-dehydropantoate 2-reductase
MRVVIFGAGAVGSVIGGRLHAARATHGHDVTLVARGPHRDAITAHGLTINDHSGATTVDVPVVATIAEVALDDGDVVMLTMKTQDTPSALEQLAAHAPSGVRVVCAQNGVENERLALRHFEHVYGICVMLPSTFLEPGVVDAHGAPHNAILDIGRYPSGADATSETVAAVLRSSGLASESRPDIMRWKYTKLVMNLRNAIDALVSDPDRADPLIAAARSEAEECFRAAGIDRAGDDEDRDRRSGVMEMAAVRGGSGGRRGGSTWQSLARGSSTTEVDWLNGEIVLLGRTHGVATPVNELLCQVTRWVVASGRGPRSLTSAQVLGWRRSDR